MDESNPPKEGNDQNKENDIKDNKDNDQNINETEAVDPNQIDPNKNQNDDLNQPMTNDNEQKKQQEEEVQADIGEELKGDAAQTREGESDPTIEHSNTNNESNKPIDQQNSEVVSDLQNPSDPQTNDQIKDIKIQQENQDDVDDVDINKPIEYKNKNTNDFNINQPMNEDENKDTQLQDENITMKNATNEDINEDLESNAKHSKHQTEFEPEDINMKDINDQKTEKQNQYDNESMQQQECQQHQHQQKQQNEEQQIKQSREKEETELMSSNTMNKIRQIIFKIKQMTSMNDNNAYIKYFNEEIILIFKSIYEVNINNLNIDSFKYAYFLFLSYIIIRTPYITSDNVSQMELNWLFSLLDCCITFYSKNITNFEESSIDKLTKCVLIENNTDQNEQAMIKSTPFLTSLYVRISNQNNLLFKYLFEFLLKINFFEKLIQRLSMPFVDTDAFLYLYCMISKTLYNYDRDETKIINLYSPLIKTINDKFNELANDPSKELTKFQMDYLWRWNMFSDFNLLDILYVQGIENSNNSDIIQLLQKDLSIAYKMSCSNNLEKRVIGIKYFNDLCFTLMFEKQKFFFFMNTDKLFNYKKMIMIDFFTKVNIFDKIYGENIHQAVITKSSMILIYLYTNNKINYDQINYLWKLSQEQHQSISESILFVFSDLIPHFSFDISMHFLKIINELSMKEVNDVTVKILESFSNNINCTNDTILAKNFKDLYLKILMKFSNETSHYNGLTAHIILKARRVLCNVLLRDNFRHDLYKYIKKCIYGIGANQIISTHLAILDMLLKNIQCINYNLKPILSVFGNEVVNYNTLVAFLEKKYTLISTILTSLLDLKKEIIFFSTELIEIQVNSLNSDSMFCAQDIMNDYEIKYSQSPNNIDPLASSENNQNIIQRDSNNDNNNSNINNNNPQQKLDITQSTEKSLDDNENGSVSSISTEISVLEKTRMIIIQNFIDAYSKYLKDKQFSLKDNYEFIFKKIRLNFLNNNYYSLTLSLLSFLKTIIFSTNINLTQSQIQYLFILFVENSVDEEEMNLFFDFFADVLKCQYLKKENFISEDNISYIFFDLLVKQDLISLPYSGFNLFNQIFFLINTTHGNLITNGGKIIDVKKFNQLFGFETLWTFYLETKNPAISSDCLSLLVVLISTLGKHNDDNCKQNFNLIFDKIFQRLFACTQSLQINKNDIETQEKAKKLINLLFIINSTKQKIESKGKELITVLIKNNYYSNEERTEQLQVCTDLTIKELKLLIIEKVLSNGNLNVKKRIEENGILINYKGKLLKDEFFVKDYKMESGSALIIFKDDPNYKCNEIDPQVLAQGVFQLKNIFDSFSDDLLKLCLKKCYGNVEEAIMYLTDESHIETLTQELIEDNANPFIGEVSQIQSANLELFTDEKINLILQLLEIGIESVNVYIWTLLSAIKYPNGFIDPITEMKFVDIFNTERKSRLLLFLQLVNSLIFGDKFFVHLKIIDNRNEWIRQLLNGNGIEIFLKTLDELMRDFSKQKMINENIGVNDYTQTNISCLNILIKWLHYFTFTCSCFMRDDNESLKRVKASIIKNRSSSLNIGLAINADSNANTNNNCNNNKDKVKNKDQEKDKNNNPPPTLENSKQSKVTAIAIDEKTSLKFLFTFIKYNFHILVLNFINSISIIKFSLIQSKNQEPEIILISLIEILMICNEINELAFLYSLDYEIQYCLLMNFLFTESSKPIRKVVENFFLIISKSKKVIELKERNIKKATNQILANHIINNYKRIYSSNAYEEFFNLFGFILTHEKEFNCENLEDFNFKDLTEHILTKIHKGSNQKELSESEQEQLTGYVHLLHCLSTNHEEIIIESIEKMTNELEFINYFYDCLFNINRIGHKNTIDNHNNFTNDSPCNNDHISSYANIQFKYSNKNLRQKCYNLLLSFMRIKPSFKIELYNKMITHHTKLLPCTNVLSDFDIPFRGKADSFIGLKNYGATCYLNSLLQQLFMMPSFIKNLYSFQIDPKEEKNLELNPIYQLQIAFANLRSTLRKYYPPIAFVKSIKTAFNGQPIALGVQQDSDEFFTILTDALEKQAKLYNNEHFLTESFKGKICNEIISLEPDCPYYNSTDESSIRITLDIKNQRTLEEALDVFIKEEILEGENKYFVEKHNKKISISKRYLIKHLSNNAIIHLKRFEFDYNRFENSKLNDYISFPHEIDFRKWMRSSIIFNNKDDERYKDVILDEEELKELNDVDSYKYVLTGILIHSGSTLQHGHYYSFIMNQESGKWYRFDDSTVREFNSENIEQECFGEDKDNVNPEHQKCQNAYLLFYTKKTNYDSMKNKIKESGINTNSISQKIPNEINEMIHNENVDFLKMKTYVDNDYYLFVKEFIDYVYSKAKDIINININENDNEKNNTKDNSSGNNNEIMIEKYTKQRSMTKQQRENDEIYQLICKIKDSSMSNINITATNINEIIHKCRCEINSNKEKEQKKKESNSNSNKDIFNTPLFLQKKLVKFGLYYYFEIILYQNDKNKITSFANFIRDKITSENYASTWFIKKIEKTPQIFFNNILLSPTQEIRTSIQQLVYSCFISSKQSENKWISETYEYIDQQPNQTDIKKEYYSCIMRLLKNVFFPNFEKGRINWQRHHQFFALITDTFNLIKETLPLTELPSLSLYHMLISFIMNNRPGFKTKFNTMGNSVVEFTIKPALEMLSTIILSSVTPGIKKQKNYSPYSKNIMQKKDNNYLELPNKWEIILQKEVMGDVLLKQRSTPIENQLVHHLAYCDINTSQIIIKSMMVSLRENFKDIYSIYNLIQNTRALFDIDDLFKHNRVKIYFSFESEIENESDLSPIFDYLFSFRDDLPFPTFFCLRLYAQMILDYSQIKQYLLSHKVRIEWIFYFLKELETNENKRTAMQIECSSQNYDYSEMFSTNVEVYIKMRNHSQNEQYEKMRENQEYSLFN